ncbi:Up in starvation protein [Ophidiomyces ophidiicola]|nr:Up in starvation protein [Ophidiomyces ophidiicola]
MTAFLPVNVTRPPLDLNRDLDKDPDARRAPAPDRPVVRDVADQALPLNSSTTTTTTAAANHTDRITQAAAAAAAAADPARSSLPHRRPAAPKHPSREGSSTQEDMQAHESEGEHYASENEPEPPDTAPPSKKKKGQRFYCRDFPPCSLSFTRSEHLARHIRKHTGERPFQCHCSRRFSRLDNLRQHAQTVHVNEEIPGDSLAASATRFQRQVRTDRIRPVGRARAGTGGSPGNHGRGHGRNLSSSSITSTVSSFSQAAEIRRRPPPLMMAGDGAARARLSLEATSSPPTTPPQQAPLLYPGQSPSTTLFTPSSSTYESFFASPSSATDYWGEGTHNRRLSVPSGSRYDAANAIRYPAPARPLVPAGHPYTADGFVYPPTIVPTPQDPQAPFPPEADWRRRTWHPGSGSTRPNPGGMWIQDSVPGSVQTGYPADLQSVPNHPQRLPGIESFDQMQQSPLAPPRREPTPMQIDGPGPAEPATHQAPAPSPFPVSFRPQMPASRPQPPISGPGHRRGYFSLDMTLHSGLNRLGLHENTDAARWSRNNGVPQTSQPELAPVAAERPADRRHPPFDPVPRAEPPSRNNVNGHGWYDGKSAPPPPQQRQPTSSPRVLNGDTAPQASMDYLATVVQHDRGAERRDSLVSGDYNTSSQPPARAKPQGDPFPGSAASDARLQALVAVATCESNKRDT